MGPRAYALPAACGRRRVFMPAICLVGLITIWLCRLPSRCLDGQCIPNIRYEPPSREKVDLSRASSPFVGWPLARVCRETTWISGLVFVCDNNSGGLGNIRNYILTCVRYAIEAGATGLVMPQIRTRSPEHLSAIMQEHRSFDYFFDDGHFRASLTAQCPSIHIYNSTYDIPNNPNPSQAERLTPRDLGSRAGCDQRDLNRHADLFGSSFRAWLQEKASQFNLPKTSFAHPRVVRLDWGVQWDYPVYRDGPELAATFGGLLKFRSDILALGQRTATLMRNLSSGSGQQRRGKGFVGMHLRTESDVLSQWPGYESQSAAYLNKASTLDSGTTYLATGNETEAAKLVKAASSDHGIRVVTKHILLREDSQALASLQSLTWDQQALIDFVVLLESDYFLGVSPSSFSINVALKRHLLEDGLHTRPWKVGSDGDGRSWLVGTYESYWNDWLFMYDSLWP